MSSKTRAVSAKGVEEFRPYITRVLPVTAEVVCADNTGAKVLRIAQVHRYKGRHSRLPALPCRRLCNRNRKKRSCRTSQTNFWRSYSQTKISN